MPIKLSNYVSLWARRIALYFGIGAAVIVALHIAFSYFNLLHTDIDSARYMLSALVQGEAAIVALVVTLSLVAVQLAAQSYSARVIEVFRRTPDLWILMGIYGGAIFYGLGVLKMIENPPVGRLSNLEWHVSFAYYLGVFAFVALVPYIWNILEMLKPSTLINMLAEAITKEKILDSIADGQEKPNDKDPVQPIIDIVNGSIMKYDYETVRVGLNAIGDSISKLLIKNMIKSEDEVKKISKLAMRHFYEIESLALNKDGGFTFEVSKNLKKIITTFCEQNLDNVAWEMIFHFGEMGVKTVRKNLDDETCWIAIDLGYIGEVAAKNNLPKASSQAVLHLGAIGKEAAEKGLIDAASFAASSIYMVGTSGAPLENVPKESLVSLEMILNACRIEAKFESTICKVVESMSWIEKTAIEHNNLNYELFNTVELLEKIGKETSEQKLKKAASETSKSLQLIARASHNHQLKWRVIEAQNEIGKISANIGLNATTWEAAMSIGNLGNEVSDDQKLKSLKFLEEIGLLACKHGTILEDASRQVINSLLWIGKTVVESNKETIALKAIIYIENVGIACKQNDCKSVTRHAAWCLTELMTTITINDKTIDKSGRILKKLNQAIDNLNLYRLQL